MGVNILRMLHWLWGRMLEWIADIKHALSPELFSCLFGGGIVEPRARVYTQFAGSIIIGPNVKIGRGTVISNYDKPGKISIGAGTSLGWYNNFYGMAGIEIGEDVLFASNVCILTANHGWRDPTLPIRDQPCTYAIVKIGSGSWIGYNVIILPGVSIGRHVVVGAGSIVTHDLPDFTVCAGNPCKVIREIDTQK